MQRVARGDEPLGDRLPRAARRRLRAPVVHADGRGRPLRPRDARERARALGRRHLAPAQQARFHTKSGLLDRRPRTASGSSSTSRPSVEEPAPMPAGLAEALGAAPQCTSAASQFDYLVEVRGRGDHAAAHAGSRGTRRSAASRGVIVTSRADTAGYDFVSRFFAPGAGVARRSGDGLGALRARSVLGRRGWARASCRLPGLGARRRRARSRRGRPGEARRQGGHGSPRRAALAATGVAFPLSSGRVALGPVPEIFDDRQLSPPPS